MRSRHADIYNHDEEASTYDRDVLRAGGPIREGYGQVLDWVVEEAGITPESVVLDLGAGAGNLGQRIRDCGRLICVDVSSEMIRIARGKLSHLRQPAFVQADILEYFDAEVPAFDVVMSTYAIHHLTEDEKMVLMGLIEDNLKPGGRAVFGDLMAETPEAEGKLAAHYRALGDKSTAAAIEEEFFWYLDSPLQRLSDLGFATTVRQFSALSWGIKAEKSIA